MSSYYQKINLLSQFLIIICLFLYPSFSHANEEIKNPQFESLKQKLIGYGFTVKLAKPPYQNRYQLHPYGAVSINRNVWINPIVFELENALPTIIHESVHAAQLCAGKGEFALLNINIEPPRMTLPHFMGYRGLQREVEAEAYTVQVQPNSFELANELLDTHCSVFQQ